MNTIYETARDTCLGATDLDVSTCESMMGGLMAPKVDAGELFFQRERRLGWSLEDGKIKEGTFGASGGVGVRAISGEKTGFAYADDISRDALTPALAAARAIVKSGASTAPPSMPAMFEPAMTAQTGDAIHVLDDPILGMSNEARIDMMRRVDAVARAVDNRVSKVSVSLHAFHEAMLVMCTDGTLCGDVRPLIRMNVSVIAEENSRRERGTAGGGGRRQASWLLEGDRCDDFAREAVRLALLNLEAVDAPAGAMPVVLGPGWPGVLLHEAVGHGLEGDFNRKGTSAFAGKMGTQVASPLCTVVDDATLADRRGSLRVDDEGTPGQRTVLIEDGKLTGYMTDKLNAKLMQSECTGNGRRESYAHLPMPRMTNTFMLPGPHDPEEILRSVKKGIFAASFGGGQVDITSGQFVFSTTEAWLVEDGRCVCPVKGATLIGMGAEVMQRVSMVGNDFALDSGIGVCGKDGQSVPVGVGQPTLKVDEIIVGGTSS
ncbi:MAG: metalloprotease TldD [Gammaproteobacteria bacterium]|nr:metalloprotease TldD [Gammaproteobacteria bacterium]MCY4276471.1 metalloprotease TldD [Gammaproteobacteria bacterium]